MTPVVPFAEVCRDQVDGVPVFWSHAPGPLTAGLVFRVGRADEQAPQGGITHVVEHLALSGLDPVLQEYNGVVEPLTTTFMVTGAPEQVVGLLARVCSALRALPAERLEAERRVLQAEAAGRGRGLHSTLLVHRFGPRGLGLPAYPELGVPSLSPEQVQHWADTRFVRGAAALWLTGPPPADLRLDLSDGAVHPPPPVHAVEALPGRVPDDEVGLSMVAARSPALPPALDLLQQRVWHRLRTRDALVYDVQVRTQVVGARERLVDVQVDPREQDAEAAAVALREEVDRLCQDGPSDDELQAVLQVASRRRAETGAGAAWARVSAVDHLLGEPAPPLHEVDARARAVRPEDVREALRAATSTALWALPPGLRPLDLREVSNWSAEALDGERLQPAPGYDEATTALVLAPDGITEVVADDRRITVRYDRCVALLQWDDGSRTLWGEDGFRLPLAPWEWVGGERLVAAVDAGVPRERQVRLGEGDGPPPPPERAPESRTGRRLALGFAWLVVLFCLALALTAPLAVDPDTEEDVACGPGSSLTVWREGARVEEPARSLCEQTAAEDVGFGAFGLVVLAVALPLTVREVRRR